MKWLIRGCWEIHPFMGITFLCILMIICLPGLCNFASVLKGVSFHQCLYMTVDCSSFLSFVLSVPWVMQSALHLFAWLLSFVCVFLLLFVVFCDFCYTCECSKKYYDSHPMYVVFMSCQIKGVYTFLWRWSIFMLKKLVMSPPLRHL